MNYYEEENLVVTIRSPSIDERIIIEDTNERTETTTYSHVFGTKIVRPTTYNIVVREHNEISYTYEGYEYNIYIDEVDKITTIEVDSFTGERRIIDCSIREKYDRNDPSKCSKICINFTTDECSDLDPILDNKEILLYSEGSWTNGCDQFIKDHDTRERLYDALIGQVNMKDVKSICYVRSICT